MRSRILYIQKNQTKVDGFLKKQGINVQTVNHKDYANMSLEELMESKELIEDLIHRYHIKK